jgi:peptidyl-dipeptidase A
VSFNFQGRQLWVGLFFLLSAGLALMSCTDNPNSASTSGAATKDAAQKLLGDAEKRLLDLNIKAGRADWVKSTFVTDDTEAIAADANDQVIAATHRTRRTGKALRESRSIGGRQTKTKAAETSAHASGPERPERTQRTDEDRSGNGRRLWQRQILSDGDKGKCLSLPDLEQIMGNSRDPEELKKAWARLASDCRADAQRLHAVRRAE